MVYRILSRDKKYAYQYYIRYGYILPIRKFQISSCEEVFETQKRAEEVFISHLKLKKDKKIEKRKTKKQEKLENRNSNIKI